MESRLPQPKAGVKKPATTVAASKPVEKKQVEESSTLTTPLKDLGKSKTGGCLSRPTTKENKPPPKPVQRAKTVFRDPVAARKAVKRPADPVKPSAVEAKRPAIRPAVRPVPSAVSGKSLRPTTAASAKPTAAAARPTAAAARPTTAKVNKWDWKTKFEIVNKQLAALKEKSSQDAEEINATIAEKLSESTQKMNEITSRLEQREIQLAETERELQQHKIDLEETKSSLEATLTSNKNYKAQVEQFSSKIQTLEQKLEVQININNELAQKTGDLEKLVYQMDRDRRVLHNTIQEMKGNIRVFCRVRPKIPNESGKALCSINYVDECTLEIGRADGSDLLSCSGRNRGTRQEFSFDKVFPPTASQSLVFEELSMLVQSAIEGYNVCVFAYGQTGSGKTYTMEGDCDPELEGMIPRTVRHIFEEMKEFKLLGWEYEVEASFLEIYNEHIVDLLDVNIKNHEIRMVDAKASDLYVTNLQVERINSPDELHQCLRVAQQNRAVAATKCNERSSRSHSIARIRIIGTHVNNAERCVGNLNLVDLAGSEKFRGEEAARATETKNINKSLANLGNVILALSKKQEHVPYRNSKLTHLLMPSLGGNSKTLMLLNISPLDDCFNETLNSLRFASNVNTCKTGNIKRTKTMLSTSHTSY